MKNFELVKIGRGTMIEMPTIEQGFLNPEDRKAIASNEKAGAWSTALVVTGLVAAVGLAGNAFLDVASRNFENWKSANSTELTGPRSTFKQVVADPNYVSDGNNDISRYLRGEIAHQGEYPSFMVPVNDVPEAFKRGM